MQQTQNFVGSNQTAFPVLQNGLVIPCTQKKPKQFADLISFVDSLPNHEVCLRGLCQLSFECFKELYGLVQDILDLPEISEEPEIIRFGDDSFRISWWEHLVYRLNEDDLQDRNLLAKMRYFKVTHKEYLEGPL